MTGVDATDRVKRGELPTFVRKEMWVGMNIPVTLSWLYQGPAWAALSPGLASKAYMKGPLPYGRYWAQRLDIKQGDFGLTPTNSRNSQ